MPPISSETKAIRQRAYSPRIGVPGRRGGRRISPGSEGCQSRLFDPKINRLDEPDVGWDTVAGTKPHDVARHKFGSVELDPLGLAPGVCTQRKHLADAFQSFFSVAFLEEAHDRVYDRHGNNHAGVNPVPKNGFRHAGEKKNIN